jgi:hypothetical protein
MHNSKSAGQNWGPYRKAWWTFSILAYVNLLISPFTRSWVFVASFAVILTFPCPPEKAISLARLETRTA